MVCTEMEAREKDCPFTNDHFNSTGKCMGSNCMGWEWENEVPTETTFIPEENIEECSNCEWPFRRVYRRAYEWQIVAAHNVSAWKCPKCGEVHVEEKEEERPEKRVGRCNIIKG